MKNYYKIDKISTILLYIAFFCAIIIVGVERIFRSARLVFKKTNKILEDFQNGKCKSCD